MDGGIVNPPNPVCGNGALETLEECDDGNLINGDGCSDDRSDFFVEEPPGSRPAWDAMRLPGVDLAGLGSSGMVMT